MRWLPLLALVALSGSARARAGDLGLQPPRPDGRRVVAILPPVTKDESARQLALLVQARASALLVESGAYHDVHIKMITSMAERDGIPLGALDEASHALRAGRRLGASRVVHAILVPNGGDGAWGGWTLRATTRRSLKDSRRASITLPGDFSRLVADGGLALAEMVFRADGLPVPPTLRTRAMQTESHEATAAFARCYARVIEQPFRIGKAVVLSRQQLDEAAAGCEEAVKADPGYAEAWAALGLVRTVAGEDGRAVQALGKVPAAAGYVPLYWLARYWLVVRYQSNDAGTKVLRTAIDRLPGFLLARGYLAQHLTTIRQYPAALDAWRAYREINPDSAYVLGQASHVLSHLGKKDEAIAEARRAVALDADSRDAAVELGSRYIDAGRWKEAITTLSAVAARPPVRGETLLRLGFAHLGAGDLGAAEVELERARKAASTRKEWRTRAKAAVDLAAIALRRGKPDAARALLAAAAAEGLDVAAVAAYDAALVKLAATLKAGERPHEASAFPVDPHGDADPHAARRVPPAGFDALRM